MNLDKDSASSLVLINPRVKQYLFFKITLKMIKLQENFRSWRFEQSSEELEHFPKTHSEYTP